MPEMGGAELVRAVRTGLNSDIPIVIITTRGEVKDRDLGMSLGANSYLTKPVDVKELIKTILTYLGGYKF
jgi:DNA-binding response OmpR family regulator